MAVQVLDGCEGIEKIPMERIGRMDGTRYGAICVS